LIDAHSVWYGLSATSFLLAAGISPAVAAAFTPRRSRARVGLAHWAPETWRLLGPSPRHSGNDRRNGGRAIVVLPSERIKPSSRRTFRDGFYRVEGIRRVAVHGSEIAPDEARAGGFLDAIGGGGWGPIVVSNLVARGNHPRYSIGSVNFAEFFVASAASATFVLTIGLSFWTAILGLAIGGAIAAPIAARLTKRVPTRALMVAVGIVIVA
jgi:hypothetical protein